MVDNTEREQFEAIKIYLHNNRQWNYKVTT